LPPTWTAAELGKRSSIERFFGRVFSLFGHFRLQRPPLAGWSAVACRVALTAAATIVVALAAHQAGRPDLIRSPKRVLAHTWEGAENERCNALAKESHARESYTQLRGVSCRSAVSGHVRRERRVLGCRTPGQPDKYDGACNVWPAARDYYRITAIYRMCAAAAWRQPRLSRQMAARNNLGI
jgi:hypothetical protein